MLVAFSSPQLDNALVSSQYWADEAGIHELLSWLRTNDPLRQITPDNYEPFWNVTKYDDIKAIEGNKKVFINDPRPTLAEKGQAEPVSYTHLTLPTKRIV